MTELALFQILKQKVLLKYQEYYPFFNGTWKNFSSQDIQKLILLIEEHCKETISEKWIYSHLKPEINAKLPRKDMLNILAVFVGNNSWDEFVFSHQVKETSSNAKRGFKKWHYFLVGVILLVVVFLSFKFYKNENLITRTIQLNNEFTDGKVNSEDVKVYKVEDSIKEVIAVKDGKIEVRDLSKYTTKLEIVSPFYKRKIVDVGELKSSDSLITKIALKPDDYAMMLKAFMLSDIKDWQTRKAQLGKILSDDLEVIIMLKDDLGAEYFNKTEFAQKLIAPTASVRRMKIVEIKNDDKGNIQFIRIKQE